MVSCLSLLFHNSAKSINVLYLKSYVLSVLLQVNFDQVLIWCLKEDDKEKWLQESFKKHKNHAKLGTRGEHVSSIATKRDLLFIGISLSPPFFFQRSTTSLPVCLLTGWSHTRLKIYVWQLHGNLSLFTPKLILLSFFFSILIFEKTTLMLSNINCKIKEHVYRNWCISHCQTWWNGCLCLFVLRGNFPASSWFFHVEMTSLETRKDWCNNY